MKVIRKRKYGVDKINFIRDKLQGYLDPVAIASEMAQNADDAGASVISFHFLNDALVVRNNSHFEEQDFSNILDIASGGKREEHDKIGAWGTGFLCVFRASDVPELFSSGKHIIFDPAKDELDEYEGHIIRETEFRLPWRKTKTQLGCRLEVGAWTEPQIQELKEAIGIAIYRLSIHLRRIECIEVYDGEKSDRPIYQVARKKIGEDHLEGFIRERWEIEYSGSLVPARKDTWLYYRSEIPREFGVEGVKDFEISISFPLNSDKWLDEHIPGTLYNFLPTPIRTDFAFQINGAFFPDNNRSRILVNTATHPDKSKWNKQVLNSLGELFARALIDIRDQFEEPRRFYYLLPIAEPTGDHDFLQPIHDAFIKAAPDLPIVFTSLGDWRRSNEIYIRSDSQRTLQEIAADYMPVLPKGTSARFREFLVKKMSCRNLLWRDVVEFLKPHLIEGINLSKAHPMIANREKLAHLYDALPSSPNAEERSLLANVPLCLLQNTTLSPFDDEKKRADKNVRDLVRDMGFLFIDLKMQERFRKLFEELVDKFRGADLIRWFVEQDWPENPFPLKDARSLIKGAKHLAEMLRFISNDLDNIEPDDLAQAPIVFTQNNLLARSSDEIFLHDDPDERARLQHLSIEFVNPDFAADHQIRTVYERADVSSLHPQAVIEAIRGCYARWREMPRKDIICCLISIYDYFARHQRHLMPEDKEMLRALPICLTQKGRLIEAHHLHRPHDNILNNERVRMHINKLELDKFVASEFLNPDETSFTFIKSVLKIETISADALIRDFMAPNYNDPRLDDSARKDLLDYIGEQMRKLDEDNPQYIWAKLQQAALIRCDDGQYRRGREVYFTSPMLDAVFPSDYRRLHRSYNMPTSADDDHVPYTKSKWYWLFSKLGVNEEPTPNDLYDAIEHLVKGPPDERRVSKIERIYNFLYDKSRDKAYFDNNKLKLLAHLAWLPARNDNARWHQPSSIFRPGDSELVGEQAPVMRFNEPTIALREFLGIPAHPRAETIASHLFDCARGQKKVSIVVYNELGRRWSELAPVTQMRLRREAVVWDTHGHYWKASRVFFQETHAGLFGSRRCYLDPKSDDARNFLINIGAKTSSYQINDSIELLKEIAADYANGGKVSEEDLRLIQKNFEHLGGIESIEDKPDLRELKSLAIVPGRDVLLHLPNRIVIETQKKLLDQFDSDAIAVVKDDRLNEPVKHFLRAIDVRYLSEVVHRRLIEAIDKTEDAKLRLHIHLLTPAFKRIANHLRAQNSNPLPTDSLIEKLNRVEIYSCSRLTARYELDDERGWQIPGHNCEENALYDNEHNILFVKRDKQGQASSLHLALELERLLFPDGKQSVVIQQLISMRPNEVDKFLDEHEYFHENLDAHKDEEPKQANLINWEIPPEPTYAIEAESEAEEPARPVISGPDRPIQPQKTQDSKAKTESAETRVKADDSRQGKPPEKTETDILPLSPEQSAKEPLLDKQSQESDEPISQPSREQTSHRSESHTTAQSPAGEDSNVDENIPDFDGRHYAMTPVLANDYRELKKKYGLTRFGDKDVIDESSNTDVDETEDDWALSDEQWDKRAGEEGRIQHVRFTLRYSDWADGCLRLHTRARQMFDQLGNPKKLRCQFGYDERSFDMFVDYEKGVIYTRDNELAGLFQAHNIPAGGIIYLEHVHAKTFSLCWKQANSRIENVMLLLLHEDGTFEKATIPAAEFPCEVSEYVLRAEKRFEDADALFAQAIGKRRVFQTICDIFGRPDAVLSYDEIFKAMQEHRCVSADTIRFELAQRPCFVCIGNNCWRFDPSKGGKPVSQTPAGRSRSRNHAPRTLQERQSQQRDEQILPTNSAPAEQPPAEVNDCFPLLEQARSGWQALNKILQPNGHNLNESLRSFIEAIRSFALQLEREIQAQARLHREDDGLLRALWMKIESNSHDGNFREELGSYIFSSDITQVISGLRLQFDNTSTESCEMIFFPLLSQIARSALNNEHIQVASSLYAMLQEMGAGDFFEEFAEIDRINRIREYIELSSEAQSQQERWQLWQDAWSKHTGFPFLRRAIQKDFRATVDCLDKQVTNLLQSENTNGAVEECSIFIECVGPVVDVWSADRTAKGAWQIIRRVFAALIKKARDIDDDISAYRQALQTAAMLPLDEQKHLLADDYLEAVEAIAEDFKYYSNITAAIALVDYGLRLVEHNQQLASDRVKIRLREYASGLCEEQGYFEQAYEVLKPIRPDRLSREQANSLIHRRHKLHQKFDSTATEESNKRWRIKLEGLLTDVEFNRVINTLSFRKLIL